MFDSIFLRILDRHLKSALKIPCITTMATIVDLFRLFGIHCRSIGGIQSLIFSMSRWAGSLNGRNVVDLRQMMDWSYG